MLKNISIELEPPGGHMIVALALPCTPESTFDFHHYRNPPEGAPSVRSSIHFHCPLHPDNLNDDIQMALLDHRVDRDVEECGPYVERAAQMLLQLVKPEKYWVEQKLLDSLTSMDGEHQAWQEIVQALEELHYDINDVDLNHLVAAIRYWGEELATLRCTQPQAQRDKAKEEALEVLNTETSQDPSTED